MISVKDQVQALNNNLTSRKNAKENATHLIKDAKDVEQEVIEIGDRKALYLLECENCVYTVQGKPIKVSIEKCKNVTLKIEDKVLTGMVDVWKSESISLDFDRSVSMFQLDNIQSITIKMLETEYFGSMVWSAVEDIKLQFGDGAHALSYRELLESNPDLRSETGQLKTTIPNGNIKTEGKSSCLRLENGFPATRAEEADHQEMERLKNENLPHTSQ
ncbi:hypothetical protein BGZ51_006633 [Haplosporangium sp. Z 767]|nr:hypothetical protein BGZ51_006633 [Haplosporangium sp. Z 767]